MTHISVIRLIIVSRCRMCFLKKNPILTSFSVLGRYNKGCLLRPLDGFMEFAQYRPEMVLDCSSPTRTF